jgi:hypothetical protein
MEVNLGSLGILQTRTAYQGMYSCYRIGEDNSLPGIAINGTHMFNETNTPVPVGTYGMGYKIMDGSNITKVILPCPQEYNVDVLYYAGTVDWSKPNSGNSNKPNFGNRVHTKLYTLVMVALLVAMY